MKQFIALLCVVFLSACGPMDGRDTTPTVSDIQVQNLAYGQRAAIVIDGSYLDTGLSATIPNCIDQTPVTTLAAQQAVTCTVTATGDMTIEIRNGSGDVIFSKTFTVPAPQVALVTSLGNIFVDLDPNAAPLTVNNFLQYVQGGFYTNTIFHRVIAGFVIQGGGFLSGLAAQSGIGAPIILESNNGLTNLRGTIAMARTSDPNSATSQFYFNLVNNPSLDYQDANNPGYAVFGAITQGLDVMDAIGAVPTATQSGVPDVPVTDVVVKAVIRLQ